MAQYRVRAKSYIADRIVEEGEIVDLDGDPSDNLEPIQSGKNDEGEPVAVNVGASFELVDPEPRGKKAGRPGGKANDLV